MLLLDEVDEVTAALVVVVEGDPDEEITAVVVFDEEALTELVAAASGWT